MRKSEKKLVGQQSKMELINEAVPCESILITFTSMQYEAKNHKKWMNLYKGKYT